MSLRRVMLCLFLAVPLLAAGWCHASTGDADGALFGSPACVLMLEDESTPLVEVTDTAFARLGRAMTAAEGFSSAGGSGSPAEVKVLPGAPAAVVMTLLGFLCVSLARDRRAWLALACGLIWLGQAGMTAAPQLARRICRRNIAETTQECGNICGDMTSHELQRNESLRYVALLRRLAGIPADNCDLSFVRSNETRLYGLNCADAFGADRHEAHVAAPVRNDSIFYATACPGRVVRDIDCFSPAFIFSNLSRGPPVYF